jgi:hypothetical protein
MHWNGITAEARRETFFQCRYLPAFSAVKTDLREQRDIFIGTTRIKPLTWRKQPRS